MKELISSVEGKNEDCREECRTKEIVSGKIVQCLVKNPTCGCFFHFGAAIFCMHPSQNKSNKHSLEGANNPMFVELDKDF